MDTPSMVRFRISSTSHEKPAPAKDADELEARLLDAYKAWLAETPQLTDKKSHELHAEIAAARNSGAKADLIPGMVSKAVKAWKDSITATHAAGFDPFHALADKLIRSKIKSVVAEARDLGLRFNVSIVGHVIPTPPDGVSNVSLVRCNAEMDLAQYLDTTVAPTTP